MPGRFPLGHISNDMSGKAQSSSRMYAPLRGTTEQCAQSRQDVRGRSGWRNGDQPLGESVVLEVAVWVVFHQARLNDTDSRLVHVASLHVVPQFEVLMSQMRRVLKALRPDRQAVLAAHCPGAEPTPRRSARFGRRLTISMTGLIGLSIRRLVSYAEGRRYPDRGGLDAAERPAGSRCDWPPRR